MKKILQEYFNTYQLKMPLEISEIIEISDPVYTFSEVLNHIDLKKYVFVNHLFAHNAIFISVENDAIDYVFDMLRSVCPGRIMLKPKIDEYFRYLVDDQIVIIRLPSESPKGNVIPWQSRLEKILVDITVDKLLSQLISVTEIQTIFSLAFDRFLLDTGAMIRYANRKGAGAKFKKFMMVYTRPYFICKSESGQQSE